MNKRRTSSSSEAAIQLDKTLRSNTWIRHLDQTLGQETCTRYLAVHGVRMGKRRSWRQVHTSIRSLLYEEGE
eukprot:756338-Hanusia_phi.AAC.1